MLPSLFLIIPIAYQIYTGKSPTIHPEINANFPSALYAFAFGILIAGLDCMGKMKKRFADIGFLGFIIWPLALVTLAWMRFQHSTSLWLHWVEQMAEMTASACLLTYVANPQHAIARLLCAPWLRWCGIISYEWYLIHQPLVLWSRDFFGPANGNVLKFVLMIGVPFMVSTVFAAFIYRCFSMPLLKWARGSYASAHS
jgi:peptidoglycan/LPS O-acetylase OafA/YrhL